MSDVKKYLFYNRTTDDLELVDFPYPEREKEILKEIYQEFAFEPFSMNVLEKMNQFVLTRLEALTC